MSSNGMMNEPAASPGVARDQGWLAFSAVALVALVAHLWLLGTRWINPDEGAHLMDGVLLLDGLFPGVDYGARQPFYVLATASVLALFGVGFVPGRMLALTCTLGAAAILYAIARDLFDSKVALLSACLFLFLPFSLMLSVNAKTEPLAVLLAAGTIWMAVKGMRGRGRPNLHFGAAGALAALAFYVRESGLALLAAMAVALVWRLRGRPRQLFGAVTPVAAGFLAVGLLMGAAHASRSSVENALTSGSINPLVFVYRNVQQLTDAVARRTPGPSGQEAGEPRQVTTALALSVAGPPQQIQSSPDPSRRVREGQPLAVTRRTILESVRFNAVLIAGALLFPLVVATRRKRRSPGGLDDSGFAALVLLAWAGSMAAAYLFWAVRRGFFQAYFLEIIPPLTILAAASVVHSAREFVERTSWVRMGIGLAVLSGALLVIPGVQGELPLSRPLYFVVPTAALAAIHLLDVREWGRWLLAFIGVGLLSMAVYPARQWFPGILQPGLYALLVVGVFFLVFWAARISWLAAPSRLSAFVSYAVIVSALFLTLAESAPRANLRYDGVWSPASVRAVSDELRRITAPGDQVLSGAVIWELQAGRRPFMNTSHPLGLSDDLVQEAAPPILRALADRPPAAVVLDGYTERTYLAAVPELRALLESRYTRTLTLETDNRYPIEVYRLNE